MSDREEGTIKFFNEDRFFGFITCIGKDYFFHGSDFEGDPSELHGGEKVSFVAGADEKSGREKALEVKVLED